MFKVKVEGYEGDMGVGCRRLVTCSNDHRGCMTQRGDTARRDWLEWLVKEIQLVDLKRERERVAHRPVWDHTTPRPPR